MASVSSIASLDRVASWTLELRLKNVTISRRSALMLILILILICPTQGCAIPGGFVLGAAAGRHVVEE